MKATSIIPCLTYQNALEAIEWLGDAFGFEKHQIYLKDDGRVSHAELKAGNIMIMISSANNESPFGRRVKIPGELDFFESQCPYVVVDSIDKHYERAEKFRAEIVKELEDNSYGGKSYMCYDPGGHLWSFGTYDPWKINQTQA